MRTVRRLFVMSALMVLSSFAMVARGVRMVFCRLLVLLGCFLRHGVFPVLGCALGKALSRQKPSERVADALARRRTSPTYLSHGGKPSDGRAKISGCQIGERSSNIHQFPQGRVKCKASFA
jgi:hypothetical protein